MTNRTSDSIDVGLVKERSASVRRSSRRRFLWCVAGSAAYGLSSGCGGRKAARKQRRAADAGGHWERVERHAWALGSTITITAFHPDATAAHRAIDAALVEIDTIEDVMSLYRGGSQICELNERGGLAHPDHRLLEVLQLARRISLRSNGAFDPTVQPLWILFHEAQQAGTLPSKNEIRRARRFVDHRCVEWTPQRVQLKKPGAQVTLNGIAQGYALDRAASVLRAAGVSHALLDTGEVGAAGSRPDGRAWQIGIRHPRRSDAFAGVACLDGRCLATSGDYATRFAADFSAHHVFDPRTGRSPTEVASVTVAAPGGMLADALSTTLCVLGVKEGQVLLSAFPRCDAFFVLKDGRTVRTPRFPSGTAMLETKNGKDDRMLSRSYRNPMEHST